MESKILDLERLVSAMVMRTSRKALIAELLERHETLPAGRGA
jgi:hypothetical protein